MYAVKLMFMSGPEDGRQIWLKSNQKAGHAVADGWEFTIGRHDECDLVIPYDTQVSRTHAALRIVQDVLWLADLDSRNGVYIYDERIQETVQLPLKTLFRIGNTWLRPEEITL